MSPQAGRARPLAAETRGAMPREDSRGAASSKCLGAARCRCSSDRSPGWRRRKGSVAGARVVVFAEHAALAGAFAVSAEGGENLPMAPELYFLPLQMRQGPCWAAQQGPARCDPTLFFIAWDARVSLLSCESKKKYDQFFYV